MIRFVTCLSLCLWVAASQSYGQRLAYRASGKYFGAYGCDLTKAPQATDCASLHVWHIGYGYYGSTIIAGKNVALAIAADSPTEMGQWRGTLYLDSTAFDNQLAALEKLFRAELADYFASDGLDVKVVPVEFSADQGVYYLRIGHAGKRRIANAEIVASAFAWWSSPRAESVPLKLKTLSHCSPLRTGEAPDVIQPNLHIGRTLANWHKAEGASWDKAGGSAVLCNFEYRSTANPDRGR